MSDIMDRSRRIKVFYDTLDTCRNDPQLLDAIDRSVSEERIIWESDRIDGIIPDDREGNVRVSYLRSFAAARRYADEGKVGVLNFASAKMPGGGVRNGSSAQEESLCRVSTLEPCINHGKMNDFYRSHFGISRLYNDDIIYTPGVVVIREDDGDMDVLDKGERYSVDVITCAAPNLRPDPERKTVEVSDDELRGLFVKRFCRIMEVAAKNGCWNLILGAFGCGAFMNDPEIVANAAKDALDMYPKAFDTIEFAVYCKPSDMRSYEVFKRILESHSQEEG